MRGFVVVISLTLVLGCRSTSEPTGGGSPVVDVKVVDGSMPTPMQTLTPTEPAPRVDALRVIVDPENAPRFFFRGKSNPTFFKPTDAEIASFESELIPFLQKSVPPSRFGEKHLSERAPTYMRQYVGHIEPDGSRLIWGNFFCHYFGHDSDKDKDGWRKDGVYVKDGGDCYFNVEFLPKKKTFRDLLVNGDA